MSLRITEAQYLPYIAVFEGETATAESAGQCKHPLWRWPQQDVYNFL